MADPDDDNYFSDSGLDALPQSTLHQLERGALSSTQQQMALRRANQYSQAARPYKLSMPSNGWQQPMSARGAPPPAHEPPSSDYGLDDEDVIDLDEPSLVIQPASGPPQRVPHDNPVHDDDYPIDDYEHAQQYAAQDPHLDHLIGQQHAELQPLPAATDAQSGWLALEARVKELERERVNLQKSVQDAETAALKKAGEIAILRAKHDKDAKEYERRIAVMQKLHADEAAKHRAEAQAAKKDRDTVETNNRFLEHDLAQEMERAKRIKPTATSAADPKARNNTKQSSGPSNASAASHSLPFRDGFDDHEIVLVSPSKAKEKYKAETPKAGEKRKRNVTASPGIPLQFTAKSPAAVAAPEELEVQDQSACRREEQDSRLQMVQRILNHRPPGGHEHSVETLARYAFPSLPDRSIAGQVLDELSHLPTPKKGEDADISLTICNHILDLWSACLDEEYYSPLYLLLDLFEFVTILAPRASRQALIERIVPLATKTIDLIVIPLARPTEDVAVVDKIKEKAKLRLAEEVNIDHVLSILHMIGMSAAQSTETCQTFWQKMEFDFTLLMMNKIQELPHIQLVLELVASSVLAESFGVISAQPGKQTDFETHTLNRLTTLIFEKPVAPSDQTPYDDEEISTLHLEAIRALSAIGSTPHGSIALAQHKLAIGRLFRFLHVQVTVLYDLPSMTWKYGDNGLELSEQSNIQKLTTMLISITTRLLHHLICHHENLINLRDKLSVIYGGHHKFIVSLTRLAFSEPLVYEAGIEEEVFDAAHDILDAVVNPDEAEGILEAFETPRGTTTTRASAPG
ncbi:hypothetical protein MBLNU459_g8040t1 [Dothideomycetes sp. NU459]